MRRTPFANDKIGRFYRSRVYLRLEHPLTYDTLALAYRSFHLALLDVVTLLRNCYAGKQLPEAGAEEPDCTDFPTAKPSAIHAEEKSAQKMIDSAAFGGL